MLKIGDFSRLTHITIRMLRHYDEIGLLPPSQTDEWTGYRYYSPDQLVIASRINAWKGMGFSLSTIRELLAEQHPDRLEALYRERLQALREETEEAARRMQRVDTAIQRLRKDESMYTVIKKTKPACVAACLRMILPNYESEGLLWQTLMEETAGLHIPEDESTLCSVVYHDGEWKENDVDCEAQKTVDRLYPDTEHVRFRALPAQEVVTTIHRGEYAQIGEAYAAVYAWCESHGLTPCGPMTNIYHVSPHETSDSTAFVTEVCLPVCGG